MEHFNFDSFEQVDMLLLRAGQYIFPLVTAVQ